MSLHIDFYVVTFFYTGDFLEAKAFDTYADPEAGDKLRDYLNSITGQ